ncbi:CotS family spore coat protein [Bacillus sp. V3-13]|uniref:CotS family spore coat protein n=1 Tax=Bacillus sp. V3-13 TaxID=2053728 RepID=UPI000C775B11|nr:CotS family spore coat protein [Bacillus sp. V3-13]PLR76078.1 CotS family spore coat protein [Bacillus sp. V3-13]
MEESSHSNDSYLKGVLDHYPFDAEEIVLLSNKSGRMTWEISTAEGVKILKQAEMNPRRMLYIADAHNHLYENGLPIVPIQKTTNGASCLGIGNHAFVVYDKAEGSEMTYYSKEHLAQAMRFAALFYQASKGYIPVEESKKRARVNKWQKLYRWKLQELEGHKKIAQSLPADPFSILFLEHVDQMLERGWNALRELDEAPFVNSTEKALMEGGFCQQDFTFARLIQVGGEAFMKELHSITQDLPTRDIRVLLNKVMKKMSIWDDDLAIHMLSAYDAANPLTEDQYRVLWTDLSFPHLFCSIIHKYYLGQKRSWSDEKYMWALQNITTVEASKSSFLHNFAEAFSQIKSMSGGLKNG